MTATLSISRPEFGRQRIKGVGHQLLEALAA